MTQRVGPLAAGRAATLLAATALVAAPTAAQQQPTFRSGTSGVYVDVSVMDGRRPVRDLTAADFAVFDNGVRQTVDEAIVDAGDLDVSVIIDLSGSVGRPFASVVAASLAEVADLIRPTDRLDLIGVDHQVRRITSAPIEPNRGRNGVLAIRDGGTALFDAVAATLMKPIEPGRRHLILAITDGLDTLSTIPRDTRLRIVARSNAVVHLIGISLAGRTLGFTRVGLGAEEHDVAGNYDYLLEEIAEGSSGRFYDLRPDQPLGDTLREAVEQFRARYLLRYIPRGVDSGGWHELRVEVPGRRYQVHARKGYFAR
jgi:VWFA-related protein